MKSREYWRKRSEQIAARQFKKADEYDKILGDEYQRAIRSIQRDIESFYQRFADNNGIVDMAEARKMLSGEELKEFRMDLKDFISLAKNNADGQWTQQLNNVYYKVRVSRFEALLMQINQQVELLAGSRQKWARDILGNVYTDTYYRNLYEIQKGTGVGVSFARIDNAGLEKVLSTKLDGRNWSPRIWDDRTKLKRELYIKLSQSFIRGDSSTKAVLDLSKRMNVSFTRAQNLIQSETAFFHEQATMDSYKGSKVVDRYELLATLDTRTSEICQNIDGKGRSEKEPFFYITEWQVGVTAPPFHARCRTTTVPYFDDDEDIGERAARDLDGKIMYVPANLTYAQWKERYLDLPIPEKDDIINYKTFQSESEIKEWENAVAPSWLERLSDKESASINIYTGHQYADINNNLRRGTGDKKYDELSQHISAGIAKFDLKDNITVFRGLHSNIFGDDIKKAIGAKITEKAFMSTSLMADTSFDGVVKMEIRVPAKSRGAPINILSQFKDIEYEFLMDKGTSYKIVDAEEDNGKIKLIAEVINDE